MVLYVFLFFLGKFVVTKYQ